MGRALLIIVLGSFIIMGMIQRAVTQRQMTMTEGNIDAFSVAQGRNATGSALEMTLSKITQGEDWETVPQFYNLMDFDVEIQIDDETTLDIVSPNELRVSAVTHYGNRQIESFAFLRKTSVELPVMDGALSVYSENSRIFLHGVGRNVDVDGNDTNPDGSEGPEDPITGITSIIPSEELISKQAGGASGKDFYLGDPPYLHDADMDDTEIQRLYSMYVENADPWSSGMPLGTDSNPLVYTIETDQSLDNDGAGILIVKPGATLTIGGSTKYNGIIIVAGQIRLDGGIKIYGGVIMMEEDGTQQNLLEEQGVLNGTPGIYYSSWVLNNLSENLTFGTGTTWIVDRMLY